MDPENAPLLNITHQQHITHTWLVKDEWGKDLVKITKLENGDLVLMSQKSQDANLGWLTIPPQYVDPLTKLLAEIRDHG